MGGSALSVLLPGSSGHSDHGRLGIRVGYFWKSVERDITTLAEAMPDNAWGFRPRSGAFENVRTFAEQIKHVACSNFAFADQTFAETPPEHCEAFFALVQFRGAQ